MVQTDRVFDGWDQKAVGDEDAYRHGEVDEIRRRVLDGEIRKRAACEEYDIHFDPLANPFRRIGTSQLET